MAILNSVTAFYLQHKNEVEEIRRSVIPDRPKTPDQELEQPVKPSPKRTQAPKPPSVVSEEETPSREGTESPRESSVSSWSEGEVSPGREDVVPTPERERTPTPVKDKSPSPRSTPEKDKSPSPRSTPEKDKSPSARSTPEKEKSQTSIRVSPIPMEPLPDAETELPEGDYKQELVGFFLKYLFYLLYYAHHHIRLDNQKI